MSLHYSVTECECCDRLLGRDDVVQICHNCGKVVCDKHVMYFPYVEVDEENDEMWCPDCAAGYWE